MSNKLIYAMSTIGSMKIEHFKELFRHVYLSVSRESDDQIEIDPRRQAIRTLDALGYCEFDFDNRRVYMCKPALVLLPGFGLPKALLVGARTPRLINKLKKAVYDRREKTVMKQVKHSRENDAIPGSIYIHATDKSQIRDIAEQTGIFFDLTSPAAWKLANLSATTDEIRDSIKFAERAEPGWEKRTFVKEDLMFSRFSAEKEIQCLTEYRHPVTKQLHHWVWDGSNAAEVSRDWGRYIILADSGCNILMYDEQRFKLAVPVTVPFPCLLARAAALCSGVPPSSAILCREKIGGIPPGHPYQVYSCVPPKIAEIIASKLNQKLIPTRFSLDKKGG